MNNKEQMMNNDNQELLKSVQMAASAYESKKRSEAIKRGIAHRKATLQMQPSRQPQHAQKIKSTRR
jgi:hypothetical protein